MQTEKVTNTLVNESLSDDHLSSKAQDALKQGWEKVSVLLWNSSRDYASSRKECYQVKKFFELLQKYIPFKVYEIPMLVDTGEIMIAHCPWEYLPQTHPNRITGLHDDILRIAQKARFFEGYRKEVLSCMVISELISDITAASLKPILNRDAKKFLRSNCKFAIARVQELRDNKGWLIPPHKNAKTLTVG